MAVRKMCGASIVACCDAPLILDFGEHVLDLMTLFVERLVIADDLLSVYSAWDTRRDASRGLLITEPVTVIASVGDECLGLR